MDFLDPYFATLEPLRHVCHRYDLACYPLGPGGNFGVK